LIIMCVPISHPLRQGKPKHQAQCKLTVRWLQITERKWARPYM